MAEQKQQQTNKIEEILTDAAKLTNNANNIIKINVNIENSYDKNGDRFNCNLIVCALFAKNESMTNIITTIKQYMNNKCHPINFKVNYIDDISFTDKHQYGINEDLINESIICYDKTDIINKGLNIQIKITYEHKVISSYITCKHMMDNKTLHPLKCPIYESMIKNDKFNQQNLNHLKQFLHFKDEFFEKPLCNDNQECKSYVRLENGGNLLSDLCHVKLYKHPPRNDVIKLAQNIHSLIIHKKQEQNHKVYQPTIEEQKQYNNDYLEPLISEIITNGFEADLGTGSGHSKQNKYSLLDIVDDKIGSDRHKSMESPLNRSEMLSLILYTGCACNYDLCKSQRNGDYLKWKWFDMCLYWSIVKLSKKESGSFPVFSGLNQVKLNNKCVECGYFVTYVSTSWKKCIAKAFMGNNNGMIIQLDETFKDCHFVYCCDVSWISKFPDECEILFARQENDDIGFKCLVLDDSNGIQTVSLRKD